MGVPKFFRWLSERYPKIIQRYGSRPNDERCQEHFERPAPTYLPPPDPLSECGLPPAIDRLYIDVNGILHGCSHNNNSEEADEGSNQITEEEIFRNICYYLDRIVKDVAKPQELLYLAIDGVAPRAKLNQQRARRYRSGREGEIEKTIYDAHLEKTKQEADLFDDRTDNNDDDPYLDDTVTPSESKLQELEPGRFTGKFESVGEQPATLETIIPSEEVFHSNNITPGTPFFQRCTKHILEFIQRKVETDPDWQKIQVVFSGPNVPGEGEHKIMQFIREQRMRDDYDPNLRHCIMAQDGDLIMLGLATHEPNLVLLREQVLFDKRREQYEPLAKKYGLDMYIHNANFEFLHMNVLRDYLAFEFETADVMPDSTYDLERTLDDFVFMTFLVGNDFLPHMPAIDIGDEAFELIFHAYRGQRAQWKVGEYLTESGNISSGPRLEAFLKKIGRYEEKYYEHKKESTDLDRTRKLEAKYGRQTTPEDAVLLSKEESDRIKFRELLEEAELESLQENFRPVLMKNKFRPRKDDQLDDETYKKMGSALRLSVQGGREVSVHDQDIKGRYYADKFGFSPFDAEKHIALRKAYIEGLVWTLKYYYEGCPSWEWYYPYHYGPMLSDLVNLDGLLKSVNFEGRMGSPLKPFEQLMACMPPSHAEILPEPYRWLMRDKSSPIHDFYPMSFTIDMNGKRWPWEAVVLLPFIDSGRLLEAAKSVDESSLTEEEKARNRFGEAIVISVDTSAESEKTVNVVPFDSTPLAYKSKEKAVLYPELKKGVQIPLPGLATLRDGTVRSLWRKGLRVNVHGSPSRYKTALLELGNDFPELHPIDEVAKVFVGQTVYINYPYLIEGLVTGVSDSTHIVRGKEDPIHLSPIEITKRKDRLRRLARNYLFGDRLPGTGGLALASDEGDLEDVEILLNVRPMKGIKTLDDGTVCKTFAKYEIEVPLFVATWKPVVFDNRLLGLPSLLEKDPYKRRRVLTERAPPKDLASVASERFPDDKPMQRFARGIHTMAAAHQFRQNRRFASIAVNRLQERPSAVRPKPFRRNFAFAFGAFLAAAFLTKTGATEFSFPTHSSQSLVPPTAGVPFQDLSNSEDEPFASVDVDWEETRSPPGLEFAHGTTTLAFVFQGGIVCAVDSRASLGNFVGSKTTQKVLPIHSHLLGTMAGGAADCMFWIRKLRGEAALQELMTGGRRMSVARASRLLSNALYENRGLGLSVGTMIMGFDEVGEGSSLPKLYYVDNSGMRIEGDLFSVGSGSTFALGILDTEKRYEMTVDEAISMGIKAIRYATFRDAFSGGFINVYLITREGWKRVFREDVAAIKEKHNK